MKLIYSLSLIVLSFSAFSQSNYQQVLTFLENSDTLAAKSLLLEWQEQENKEAEYYTCFFNYYVLSGKEEIVQISRELPTGEYFEIKDSLGKVEGYMASEIFYKQSKIDSALQIIDKGISIHPDRLDMRFGKIYLLGELKRWNSFSGEIIQTLKHSAVNNNNWTWTLNDTVDDAQNFLLAAIQDYQQQIYQTENDHLLKYMKDIAAEVLNHYPNHVESITNLSVVNIIQGDYLSAIDYLERAEQIHPDDFVVINNLAYCYKELGEKDKAIQYYNLLLEKGDSQGRAMAKEQLSKLKE